MRPFRLAVVLLAVLPWTAPCEAHPRAVCAVTRCDYGDRLPGPLPPAQFSVTNRGDEPLILQPQLCCGIRVTGAETPIAPGAVRCLVAFPAHPLGEGEFRKTIRV